MKKDIYSTLARLIEIIDEQVRPAIREMPESDTLKAGTIEMLGNFALRDSILPPFPDRAPFVAIDPVAATPDTYAGGTRPLEIFHFDIYVASPLPSLGTHAKARRHTQIISSHILSLARLYTTEIKYGEEYIGSNPYSVCQISCTFPI